MSGTETTSDTTPEAEEHFVPTGTVFFLVCYMAVLILLWASVYVILLSRGVTV